MADEYGGWDWGGYGTDYQGDWGQNWDPNWWGTDYQGDFGDWWNSLNLQGYGGQPQVDPWQYQTQQFDPSAMFASNFRLPDYGDYGMEPQSPWASQYPVPPATKPDFGPGLANALNPLQPYRSGEHQQYGSSPNSPTLAGQGLKAPSTSEMSPEQRRHEEMMAMFSRGQRGGDVLGSGMSGSDIAGLSQLLLGAGGAIAGAVSGGPKQAKPPPLTPQQQALIEAQIKNLEAQTERTLNPIFPPSKGGGGGPSRPVLNMEALKARETALIAAYTSEIDHRYAQEEQRVLERANRIGSNPAGELARLAESKQRELKQLAVEARGQALKEALGFDTPSSTLSENLQ